MSCLLHGAIGNPHVVTLVGDLPGLRPIGSVGVGRMRLPSEAIGSTTVTFEGIKPGSEVRIYNPYGIELAGIETCATDQALSFDVFAPAYNLTTIRIIHLDYKIKEFTYRPVVGAQSIPIQQEPDHWYKNPL